MDGSKKNNIGIVRESENQADHNGAYSIEGERVLLTQSMRLGGRKVPTDSIKKAGTAAGWTMVNGKRHVDGNNTKNKDDGMEHHSVNVGYINVRFMRGNGKGFNVSHGLNSSFLQLELLLRIFFCSL
jgi:hypothetical protein